MGQAVALGVLHGPVELLPVSSSGHITALPWLLGWDYEQLDPQARKGFEVALHAGTAAALLIASRRELLRRFDRRRAAVAAVAAVPPAVVGALLEPMIERRLGTAPTVAAGLIGGSALMLMADQAPQQRGAQAAGPADALWLGLAQACALVPGISRYGATLAAARFRGFRRADAARLSYEVGLPVIVGAAAREALGLRRQGFEPGWATAVGAGAAAAFGSTLIATRLIREDGDRPISRWAVYRMALAALILIRRGRRVRSCAHDQGQNGSA